MTFFILPPPGVRNSSGRNSWHEFNAAELRNCEGLGSTGFAACSGAIVVGFNPQNGQPVSALILHSSEQAPPGAFLGSWLTQQQDARLMLQAVYGQASGLGGQMSMCGAEIGRILQRFCAHGNLQQVAITDSTLAAMIRGGRLTPCSANGVPNSELVGNQAPGAPMSEANPMDIPLGGAGSEVMPWHHVSTGRNPLPVDQASGHWEENPTTPRRCSCGTVFTFFHREHHCRLCGGICCSTCASQTYQPGWAREEWCHNPGPDRERCALRRRSLGL